VSTTVAVGVLAVGVVACGGDDADEGGADATGDSAVTVRLEPIGSTTPNPFMGDLDLDPPGADLAIALPDVPPLGRGLAAAVAGLGAEGDTVGLYGGSRDAAVCDVEQLAAFLTDDANRAKAEAWATVAGIEVDGIADHVAGLTAVRLRRDTSVTNHGFAGGRAVAVQSILQAGTAVLVDAQGAPRVRCSCGNPLLEPSLGGGSAVENPDDAWEGFDSDAVVTVRPAQEPMPELTLLDIETGELFARPAGTNGDDDHDVADLEAKCELVPESTSCGGSDLEAFCGILLVMQGAPSLQVSASGDADSVDVTVRNNDEILAFIAARSEEIERLPAVAPEEIRADVQAYVDALQAALAAGDANLMFPSLEVLTRLGTFFEANC